MWNSRIFPGFGANVTGSSALMRNSMAWPRRRKSPSRHRQRLPGGDADLLFHEIDAGHFLGHRVLDLDARVHLHEVELAVLKEELDRAGVDVVDGLAELDRRLAHRPAQLLRRAPATAILRSASDGGAGSSTRARRGGRCGHACRRRPGSRCGADARGTFRCRRPPIRTRARPRCGLCRRRSAGRIHRRRCACRVRRRRPRL